MTQTVLAIFMKIGLGKGDQFLNLNRNYDKIQNIENYFAKYDRKRRNFQRFFIKTREKSYFQAHNVFEVTGLV